MSNWKPQKGDRITWRGKPGVVTDNYWADRDRFTIRLDDGSESDHGAESLRPEVREAQHSPRAILAKAYRDNGDIGAANYIEGGYDLLPDTQVHLLAIQDALAVPYTPKPPAGGDAGAVRCGWCRDFPDSERCDCAALALPAPVVEGERWRHVKRGTVYEVIGYAELQNGNVKGLREGAELVVYRGEDGKLWARERGEFHDGRFAALSEGRSHG